MEIEIKRLNLLSPLYYIPGKDSDPFGYCEGDGEKLFCFELDEALARDFEPDKTKLLKNPESPAVFPQGNYLFAQKREILSQEDIIDVAVEIQQEGLWQRLQLGEKLYLRYLFEDGCPVTQLFRPYTVSGEP